MKASLYCQETGRHSVAQAAPCPCGDRENHFTHIVHEYALQIPPIQVYMAFSLGFDYVWVKRKNSISLEEKQQYSRINISVQAESSLLHSGRNCRLYDHLFLSCSFNISWRFHHIFKIHLRCGRVVFSISPSQSNTPWH